MEKTMGIDSAFVEETRKLRNDFENMMALFSTDLWNFCKYVTGSPWDGEDLYQETLIKAFGMLPQRWSEITNKKYYLFRVATNTWLDQCRKQKRMLGTLDQLPEESVDFTDQLLLEDVLISLDKHLTPKQTVAFLLFDIFQFSAEEVAGIVKTTPGGVYATLQRVRKKIKTIDFTQIRSSDYAYENNATIQAYLEAFNNGDLKAMLELYSCQAHHEAFLGFQEYSKDEMKKGSLQFGLPGHIAKEVVLWGKPVIIVIANTHSEPELHDVQYQEVENGKIVGHHSYFFRKEFILAAAKELGIKAQLVKPPVDWR